MLRVLPDAHALTVYAAGVQARYDGLQGQGAVVLAVAARQPNVRAVLAVIAERDAERRLKQT